MTAAIFYDIMVFVSLSIMTLGIVGVLRMPDVYTKLHGASKSVFLGIVLLSLSATVVSTEAMVYRIILIVLLVVMTTPIASHVIGAAAYRMQERMETPGAVDESHTLVREDEEQEEPSWRL
jgi:multicomponent Na+:H+ antiporter subunit G